MNLGDFVFAHHHSFTPALSWFVVFSVILYNDSFSRFQVGWRQYGNISIIYTDNRLYILPKRYACQILGSCFQSILSNNSCGLCCHPALHFVMNNVGGSHLLQLDHLDNEFSCSLCYPVSSRIMAVSHPYHTRFISVCQINSIVGP